MMTEAEVKDFFDCIAKAYKPNGKFKLESSDTGDIELTNDLIVSFDDDYCELAYMPENSFSFRRPKVIVIGKPFTFQNAYNVFMGVQARETLAYTGILATNVNGYHCSKKA